MQAKPADKFRPLQQHHFFYIAVLIIFVTKFHFTIGCYIVYPVIADSNLVGIAA